jgi:hypothetical protein
LFTTRKERGPGSAHQTYEIPLSLQKSNFQKPARKLTVVVVVVVVGVCTCVGGMEGFGDAEADAAATAAADD